MRWPLDPSGTGDDRTEFRPPPRHPAEKRGSDHLSLDRINGHRLSKERILGHAATRTRDCRAAQRGRYWAPAKMSLQAIVPAAVTNLKRVTKVLAPGKVSVPEAG